MPAISVLIPSHGRARKLAACIAPLAEQTRDLDAEVLIGFDGPDESASETAERAWSQAGGDPEHLRFMHLPRRGANESRTSLLEASTGPLVITLNDDVVPEDGFLEAHRRAHEPRMGHPMIAVGYSPYLPVGKPTAIDRLVSETDLVFFWRRMLDSPNPAHDHGFRCAVTLNFSAPRDAIIAAGGFAVSLGRYGHDDIELAHRMQTRLGCPVHFVPGATAHHDHRHTAEDLLQREYLLGASMAHYARLNPDFGSAIAGHDVCAPETLDYYRLYIDTERRDAQRAAAAFLSLADVPASNLSNDLIGEIVKLHVPARRWLWRRGLLDAPESGGTEIDPAKALSDLGICNQLSQQLQAAS
ncbi:MAG: glycosyltransferase [Planctomycetota bacterium]